MDSPSALAINQIKLSLDRYKIKDALQLFFDDSTLKLLGHDSDFMWDVIPLICKRLRGLCQYRFRVFEGCEKMLCRIAVEEECNPKEVLISLLAGISHQDQHDDDNVFRAVIRPLEATLLRMNHPSPRDENYRWVLNVLIRYVNDIEPPTEYDLEKRAVPSNDPTIKRFSEVLPLILNFIEDLNDRFIDVDRFPMPDLSENQLEEVFNGELIDDDLINNHSPSKSDSLDASVTALLGLMYRPLTFLDLTESCKELKLFANKCLNTILRFRPNLFAPIYKRLNDKSLTKDTDCSASSINICSESTVSHATCLYLYKCEHSEETMQSFPQVITHEYMLISHITYVVSLLERSEILVHEKGLKLLQTLLRPFDRDSLDQKFFRLFESTSLLKQLFRIMVFSSYSANRRTAYDIFTCICDLLSYDGKLKLFKFVLTQDDLRPCIRAASIDQYRKYLTSIYRKLIDLHQQSQTQSSGRSSPKNEQSSPMTVQSNRTDVLPNASNKLGNDLNQSKVSTTQVLTANLPTHGAISLQLKPLLSIYKAIGGHALIEFLDLCIKACLPDSQHTDIIENYELLLATLTMLRFLNLRKPVFRNNVEEEYLSSNKLKKIFFDPVRSAIALITSELKSHHKEIVEGHKTKNAKITQGSILSVTQSRNELGLLSRILGPKVDEIIDVPKESNDFNEQDETDCLNWALCRLDLVESILVRTVDLYNC